MTLGISFFRQVTQLSREVKKSAIPVVPDRFTRNTSTPRGPRAQQMCYKVMQVFMVTGLFAGQHNTKLHGTITGVIYTIVGSALLRD